MQGTKEELDRLNETRRHNLADEANTRRGQDARFFGDVTKAAGSLAGSIIKGNHPEWYYLPAFHTDDAGLLSFAQAGQVRESVEVDSGIVVNVYQSGCITIWLEQAMGIASDYISQEPISRAARNLINVLKQNNLSSLPYDEKDIIAYIFCVAGLYTRIAAMEKYYGTLQLRNAYVPDFANNLLFSAGVDPTDIRRNAANLRLFINNSKVALCALPLPKGLTVIDRWIYYTGTYFKDATTQKSKLYQFNWLSYHLPAYSAGALANTYEVTRTADTAESRYIASTTPSLASVYDLETDVDVLLEECLGNTVFGKIAGDIRRAFTAFHTLDALPIDVQAPIVYDEDVLDQIENMSFVGRPIAGSNYIRLTTGGMAYQGVPNAAGARQFNFFVYTPGAGSAIVGVGAGNADATPFKLPLHTHEDQPSREKVLSISRLKVMGTLKSGSYNFYSYDMATATWVGTAITGSLHIDIKACGSELPCCVSVMEYNYDSFINGGTQLSSMRIVYSNMSGIGGGNIQSFVHRLQYVQNAGGQSFFISGVENNSMVAVGELRNMHRSALLTEWGALVSVNEAGLNTGYTSSNITGKSNSSGTRKHKRPKKAGKGREDAGKEKPPAK